MAVTVACPLEKIDLSYLESWYHTNDLVITLTKPTDYPTETASKHLIYTCT